jgi:hypothetical protein
MFKARCLHEQTRHKGPVHHHRLGHFRQHPGLCHLQVAGAGQRETQVHHRRHSHGQYLRKAQLTNAGDATPEAAMESALWAMANGDYNAFLTLLTPQMQKEMNRTFGDAEKFAAETQKEMAAFKGMQILARKTLSDDKVELKFHIDILNTAGISISANNDRTQLMVKSGDAWKIGGGTKSYRPGWDQGRKMERVHCNRNLSGCFTARTAATCRLAACEECLRTLLLSWSVNFWNV